ncbi:adenosine 3'-phospho 5'-phosphosulfate transporter 1-like [Corticium candelabrum]|uniref:adenosine 3'-phospho 5'-phosphosulfate transporter 1-like n=1 Tax=Corticium candelabrum TaxID=121492 RepID=UPI002E26FE9C|nr:adenosine 3'-phospho 5'-phosphosulfate transporter 1-like [Corticium candelabrum]
MWIPKETLVRPVVTRTLFILCLLIALARGTDHESVELQTAHVNKLSNTNRVKNVLSSDSFIHFVLNLLGYSTVIVPAAFLIRYLKSSSWLNQGSGPLIDLVKICIVGKPDDVRSTEDVEKQGQPPEEQPRETLWWTTMRLVFCFVGLQASYLTWGVLQERIMTRDYGGEKFTNSQFLVFVNRVLAFFIAGAVIMLTKQPVHRAPMYKYSYCSISNILSSWCQYEALKFVTFPIQVLAKASKVIPVMIMGKFVSRKSYSWHEYATAVLISIGASLFLLASSHHSKNKATETTTVGLIILFGYMIFDSFTSNWQSELFKTYKMSPVQCMFGVNLFSCLFTVLSLIEQGEFFSSLMLLLRHNDLFFHALLLSICSACGQLFIFYTVSAFGPIIFTIIMTTRQVMSILLSCLIYGHTITTQAGLGVIIVFFALSVRVYAKSRTSPKQ